MKQKIKWVFLALATFAMLFLSERPIYFATALWLLLFTVSYVDFHSFKIPNILNAALLAVGVGYNIYIHQTWWLPAISFLVASLILFIVSVLYARIRGVQGMGGGDIKLFAASAVWLIPEHLPFVLLLSSLTAILYFMASKTASAANNKMQKIPYGPFLSIAIWATWLYGDQMILLFL